MIEWSAIEECELGLNSVLRRSKYGGPEHDCSRLGGDADPE